RGIRLATGKDLRPLYHYERAKVILSLEADFLLSESENIAAHKGFSKGRKVLKAGEEMNRLYVVENHFSITGGMADHRLRLQTQKVGAFALALAHALKKRGLALDIDLPGNALKVDPVWLNALADDLMKNMGKSLIVAGRTQPAEVHALVLALNKTLGNVGAAVEYLPLQDALLSSKNQLADLVRAMNRGEVETLVTLDVNPAYDAPADLNWRQAAGRLKTHIHCGLYLDETARQAHWHLPLSHYLEAWGDGRNADGSLSVAQPMIAPLYDSKSALEVVHLLTTGLAASGYELVRATWKEILPGQNFEKRWKKVLNDGYLAPEKSDLLNPRLKLKMLSEQAFQTKSTANEILELVFRPSPTVFDGRFANNGWLQELPDPVTKLTWGNGLLLSPKTAQALQVGNGDVVELEVGQNKVKIPVWIQPGHADQSASLLLGYGRTAGGKIASGVGINVSALRTVAGFDFTVGARLRKTGEKEEMATTQDHGSMEGRPLVREATVEEYKNEPHFAEKMEEHPPLKSLWKERAYDEGYQWGMTIDLNSCSGCNACVVACQSENNIPIVGKEQVLKGREMHWIRLDRYYAGDLEDPEMVAQPMACAQCENAPCEQVCPVQATTHDAEGLNVMTYNRCIGTRYCSNNCPFKVRRFNFFNYTGGLADTLKMAMNPDVTVRSRGVMEKCTYCVQRINQAKINSKNEGRAVRDGEIKTACEQACPADAIVFGNINDPNSAVSKMKQVDRDYNLLSGLNLKTRTSYLARLRNPNPLIEKRLQKKEMEGGLVS
ncbi:4Fe-4S dicluster domain-containing protein, partial [Caldithrix abyssi]